MNPTLAETLLDDLSTDGKQLHSEKIQNFGSNLLALIQFHNMDIPPTVLFRLNG